jgi:hypothetical protein
MKKIILLVTLINLFQFGKAQIIIGTVLDKSDNNPVTFASVYINGTSAGTNTDKTGHFELDISKYSSLPLTISALGYYTATLSEFSAERPIVIYLSPKIFELNEVIIEARSTAKERKANLKLFREQFLGSGYNGKNCVIQNEEDITFRNSNDTLKAFASKPVLIINNALGYKITYYLDKFEYCWKCKSFLYQGNAFFNEDLSAALTKKDLFENRRRNAYLGSRSHFFSSLWTNSLQKNGFILENSSDQIVKYEDIVIVRAGFKKFLSFQGNLNIYYLSKSRYSSIEPLKGQFFFDSNGYFDGSGVNLSGQMAKQRIGDLLPLDFKPE